MTKCFLKDLEELKEEYNENPQEFVKKINSYDIIQTEDNGEILKWVDSIVYGETE
jgi:hypothetical protein|tara:strand:+ start:1272 stop:1436 length:165 start_codon:yes stop_codon:yes gene_type:complete